MAQHIKQNFLNIIRLTKSRPVSRNAWRSDPVKSCHEGWLHIRPGFEIVSAAQIPSRHNCWMMYSPLSGPYAWPALPAVLRTNWPEPPVRRPSTLAASLPTRFRMSFRFDGRVVNRDVHEKPVKLGFRQWVGTPARWDSGLPSPETDPAA